MTTQRDYRYEDGGGSYSTLDFLTSHRLYGVLPVSVLHDLAPLVVHRRYPKSHYLYYAGDPVNYVFTLVSGLVAATELDQRGKERVMLTFSRGDVFPSTPTMLELPHAHSALAVTDSTIFLVKTGMFRDLYGRFQNSQWR